MEKKRTLARFKLSLAVIIHAQLLQKIKVRLKTHQVTTVIFWNKLRSMVTQREKNDRSDVLS